MNILFLGSLFTVNNEKIIVNNSKKNIDNASNTLQWNFVRGIQENIDGIFSIISAPLIGSYPFLYKKLFVVREEFKHSADSNDVSVGFCNLAVFKNWFIKKELFRNLERWATQKSDETRIIVVYGMIAPWILSAIKIKERYPNIRLCLIVPDLPEFMSNSTSFIYKIRNLFQVDLYKYISVFDSFVFLTDEMTKHFGINNKPWVRIEGMINPDEINVIPDFEKMDNVNVVMYSGTLAERYGILNLLNAFQSIEESNYELWICGAGNTQDFIQAQSKIDTRIKFFGLLPREKVLELQRKATVLVNPRSSDGEYTKYSFPSKIVEYLLSGTPCIMSPLPGIPQEYYKFIFLVVENDALALKKRIVEICNLDNKKLLYFGMSARNFVITEKNYKKQTEKMINMFKLFYL